MNPRTAIQVKFGPRVGTGKCSEVKTPPALQAFVERPNKAPTALQKETESTR